MALIRFDDFDDVFGGVNNMVQGMMNNMMNNMLGGMGGMMGMRVDPFQETMSMMPMMPRFPDPHAIHSYSGHSFGPSNSISYSSSVMTMSSDGRGRPMVYEATSSSRSGPGGIRETQSSVRDSATGYHEMSIGRHIHDRSHIMQRTRNAYTGDEEHNNEYINLEEEEAPEFNREFQRRSRGGGGEYRHHHQYRRQIPAIRSNTPSTEPELLALPAPSRPSSVPRSDGVDHRGKVTKKSKKDKRPYKKMYKM